MTAVRMTTTKGALFVVLLVGWMVSAGGADETGESSQKGGVEAADKVSPFAEGLPKRKDSTSAPKAHQEAREAAVNAGGLAGATIGAGVGLGVAGPAGAAVGGSVGMFVGKTAAGTLHDKAVERLETEKPEEGNATKDSPFAGGLPQHRDLANSETQTKKKNKNPFAGGLPKREDSTDGNVKEKNKQFTAVKGVNKEKVEKGEPTEKEITETKTIQQQICTPGKRECQAGSIKECNCDNTGPEAGEFATCAWVATGEWCGDQGHKADAGEKMDNSIKRRENEANATQKGLDQAFDNTEKANAAIEDLGRDERKSDGDTDFLIPME